MVLPPFADMYESCSLKDMPTCEEEYVKEHPVLDEQRSIVEILVNKLGQYFEGDESNTTPFVISKGLTIKGIIDGYIGVNIIIKSY